MLDGHAISDRHGEFARAAVLTEILHSDLTELALDPKKTFGGARP